MSRVAISFVRVLCFVLFVDVRESVRLCSGCVRSCPLVSCFVFGKRLFCLFLVGRAAGCLALSLLAPLLRLRMSARRLAKWELLVSSAFGSGAFGRWC